MGNKPSQDGKMRKSALTDTLPVTPSPTLYPANLNFSDTRGKSITCAGWVASEGHSSWSTENMKWVENLVVPAPEHNQVRVKMYAAGVNPCDVHCMSSTPDFWGVTEGHTVTTTIPVSTAENIVVRDDCGGSGNRHPRLHWSFPYRCGMEGAGVVESVGWACADSTSAASTAESSLRVGDRVMFLRDMMDSTCGTFGQYVTLNADIVCRIPDVAGPDGRVLDFAEAATLPAAAQTAYVCLFDKLRIEAGRSIFVSGASGGVGSVAVQLAHYFNLHVIASCSTPNVRYVQGLGADVVLDYTRSNVVQAVLELTEGYGVDYVLEVANGSMAEDRAQTLRFGGAICVVSGLLTPTSDFIFRRQLSVHYVMLGALHHSAARSQLAKIGEWLSTMYLQGAFEVLVEEVALSRAATAVDVVARCHTRGKIVLTGFHPGEDAEEKRRRGRVTLHIKMLAKTKERVPTLS